MPRSWRFVLAKLELREGEAAPRERDVLLGDHGSRARRPRREARGPTNSYMPDTSTSGDVEFAG
jgi:hypothetical protein